MGDQIDGAVHVEVNVAVVKPVLVLRCRKYPYIHGHFVASFPHFNGTGSVAIYGCKRIRNRFR